MTYAPANESPASVFFETLVTGNPETEHLCRTEGAFLRSLLEKSAKVRLVEAPEYAEVCLVYTPSYQFRGNADPKRSALLRCQSCVRAPSRTIVLNLEDRPFFRFPTLTPTPTRQSVVAAPTPYLHYLRDDRAAVAVSAATRLTSFVGDLSTHRIRNRLVGLCKEMGWLAEGTPRRWPTAPAARAHYRNHYYHTIASSRFVLCPRGISPSTIRVFEVMRAGRVPVIISDAFIPPGPCDWSEFAIFVGEKNIGSIPTILKLAESRFESMANRARQAWESHFGPDAVGSLLMATANKLVAHAAGANRIDYLRENIKRVASGESRFKSFVRQRGALLR